MANSHLGLKLIPKTYHQEPDGHEAEVHGHTHTICEGSHQKCCHIVDLGMRNMEKHEIAIVSFREQLYFNKLTAA